MNNEATETMQTSQTEFVTIKHSTKDYITFFVIVFLAFTLAMWVSSKLI